VTEPRRTYRFGPVERHSFLGSVRIGQALVVLSGALGALLLLGSSPTTSHAVGGLTILTVAIAISTAPLGGRTLEQWAPVGAGWLLRRLVGAHDYRSGAPSAGSRVVDGHHRRTGDVELSLPPALTGVRIIGLPYRGHSVGVISEHRGRFLTLVLACRVMSFSLLDAGAQERSLNHWGSVLSSCADTPIRRLQWLERTAPTEGDELAQWLRAQRDPRIPARGVPIIDSYLELIERTVQVSREHEILIAVQIDTTRFATRHRDVTAQMVTEETERVADGLRRAGAYVQGALPPGHLAQLFRTAFDPYTRMYIEGRDARDAEPDAQGPWPLATSEGWGYYQTDGAAHATYWVSDWPRVEVGPLFLDPLLSHAQTVRTVAVTFEPLSAERSIREAEAQVTRDQADRALKARFGQTETSRHHQAYDATRRRESELAAGYGEVRFAGFVTVSAPDPGQLHGACSEIRRDAARARIEMRAMYGQQADAFTFTLPLCRGLR